MSNTIPDSRDAKEAREASEGRNTRDTRIWLVRESALPLGERLRDGLGATLVMPWRGARDDALEHARGRPFVGASAGIASRASDDNDEKAESGESSPSAISSQREQFRASFHEARRWVLVMASGIAVRMLDGLPSSKFSDPAVVVVDESARFAISLLSGHEGGANALAYDVARLTGAVPVVTTATEALKPLVIGVGCRRGATVEQIEAAVEQALAGRSIAEVREIATIDLKADEPGILEWCKRYTVPLRVFAHEQIAARPWTRTPSAWVQHNIGLDGVCEPCALLASARGALVVGKTTLNGVAIAIADDSPPWMHRA